MKGTVPDIWRYINAFIIIIIIIYITIPWTYVKQSQLCLGYALDVGETHIKN